MTERTCADCGHEEGYHDPCSRCSGVFLFCRAFATEKTKPKSKSRETAKRATTKRRR